VKIDLYLKLHMNNGTSNNRLIIEVLFDIRWKMQVVSIQ